MKKLLVVTLVLSSFSAFADHHEGHKKPQQVVMCKKQCGALENSQVDVKDCKVVRIMNGCACGTHQEVAEKLSNCKQD